MHPSRCSRTCVEKKANRGFLTPSHKEIQTGAHLTSEVPLCVAGIGAHGAVQGCGHVSELIFEARAVHEDNLPNIIKDNMVSWCEIGWGQEFGVGSWRRMTMSIPLLPSKGAMPHIPQAAISVSVGT
jgi:hypothetical protein